MSHPDDHHRPAEPWAPGQPSGQPYAQPGQPYGQGYGYAPVTPTSTSAVVALVAGIAGLTILPVVASIVAVIAGYSARKDIARTGEGGAGFATAGIITGWIGIGLAVAGLLLFVVVFLILGVSFTAIASSVPTT